METTGEIRDLIRAAAEGASDGVAVLRAAGIPASLGGFAVEVEFSAGSPHGPEVGALVRLGLVVLEAPAAGE